MMDQTQALERIQDHWLVKEYRNSCSEEGACAWQWVEELLMKIPAGTFRLKFRLNPPGGFGDEQPLDSHDCRCVLKLLTAVRQQYPRIMFKSLDLSGNPVGNALLRDLCQNAYNLGKASCLQDLILSNCDLASVRPDDDAVRILSLCRPIRRSLQRLVLSKNWELMSVNRVAWKRLIGHGKLKMLCLHDTGIQDDGIGTLCQILSLSESARQRLVVLRLGPPSDVPSFTISTFSLLVECMRSLQRLEVLEIKGLSSGQRESVSHEWDVMKSGEGLQTSTGDVFRLSISLDPIHVEKFHGDNVEFQARKEKNVVQGSYAGDLHANMDYIVEGNVNAPGIPTSRLSHSRDPVMQRSFPVHRKKHTHVQRRSIKRQNPRTVSSKARKWRQPRIHDFAIVDQHVPISADATNLDIVSQDTGCTPRDDDFAHSVLSEEHGNSEPGVGSDGSWPGALRQPGVDSASGESYSSGASDGEEEIQDISGNAGGGGAAFDADEILKKRKRRKLNKLYGDPHGMMKKNKNKKKASSGQVVQGKGCEFVEGSGGEDRIETYDPVTEKMYGAPPGGRVFRFNEDEDSDLQGYFSDGFIRPDEEIVYTTSASDCSVEQDLRKLRRPLPELSSGSSHLPDAVLDDDTGGNVLNEDEAPVEVPGQHLQNTGNPSGSGQGREHEDEAQPESGTSTIRLYQRAQPKDRKAKKSKQELELEKELASLQPFYYDRFREKYRPGKIFATKNERQARLRRDVQSGFVGSEMGDSSGEMECSDDPSDESPPVSPSVLSPNKSTHNLQESNPEVVIAPCQEGAAPRLPAYFEASVERSSPELSQTNMEATPPISGGTSGAEDNTKDRKDWANSALGREAKRLSVWSWDKHFQDVPPNISMYLPAKRVRTRNRVERFQPEFKAREPRGTSSSTSSGDMGRNSIGQEGTNEEDTRQTIHPPDRSRAAPVLHEDAKLAPDPWSFPDSGSEGLASPEQSPGISSPHLDNVENLRRVRDTVMNLGQDCSKLEAVQINDSVDIVPESDDGADL